MQITIPNNLGGELAKLEGPARAVLERIILGNSKAGKPKVTFKYTITEEMDGYGEDGGPSAIGENILESFSLQPQALFKLNEVWKAVTNENIPQGDYTEETFMEMLNETLTGTEWDLILALQIPDGQTDERTVVETRSFAG
jgi:hypothetical protein